MTSVSDTPVLTQIEELPLDDPLMNLARPDRTLLFNALGFRLKFETDSSEIEEVARKSFGPHVSDDQQDLEPDVVVRLLSHEIPEDPHWVPRQPLYRGQDGYAWIAASRQSIVCVDMNKAFSFGFLSPEVRRSGEFLKSAIVEASFYLSLHRRVLGSIHAATISKRGASIMLRGESNSGKSTLAYAAVRSGFSLVDDDAVQVRDHSDELTLHGLPWTLYLLPDALGFFPELEGQPLVDRVNGETKIALNVAEMYPGQTLGSAPMGPTVFVTRSQTETARISPVDTDEALRRFDETAIVHERGAVASHGLWEQMIDKGVYQIAVGSDFDSAVRLLDELL